MKHSIKIKLLFLSICILSLACSKTEKISPKDMGEQAFSLLHSLDTISIDTYKSYFTKTDSETERDFNRIKKKGNEFGINWGEIKYLNYLFEERKKDNMRYCSGTLYFIHEYRIYTIDVTAIIEDGKYILAEVQKLYLYCP